MVRQSRSSDGPHPVDVGRPITVVSIGDEQVRSVTAEQAAAAADLGMMRTWYGWWLEAGFTPSEIAEWFPLTTYRCHGPDAAVALRRAEVTAAGFRAAIDEMFRATTGDLDEQLDAIGAANRAVLMQEVAEFFEWRSRAAALVRNEALTVARQRGATTVDLAARFGWSKQRIDQLTGPSARRRVWR